MIEYSSALILRYGGQFITGDPAQVREFLKSHALSDVEALLMQRNYLDFAWDTFGGRLDSGETPHQALKRELAEEAGIEIATAYKIGTQWRPHKKFKAVRGHLFLVVPANYDAATMLAYIPPDDEVKDTHWYPLPLIHDEDPFVISVSYRYKQLIEGAMHWDLTKVGSAHSRSRMGLV